MIRVGLIGFGLAGRVFHAPLISSVEGLELAAVLERTTSRAAERYPGIAICRSLDQLLTEASLRLIVVATPNQTHFELARRALEAGKHVVVDKPVGVSAVEIAALMGLAEARGLHLFPFHNRRWDSDFRTIIKVLHEGSIGRLVHFESRLDRWRPTLPTDRVWKNDPGLGGGLLLDLGTHLADQALSLFGVPEAVGAELWRERDGAHAEDSFTVRLDYPGLRVTLGANALSLPPGPRFHLRGTEGNYWKHGVDGQEAALGRLTRIDDPNWGCEPPSDWGHLEVGIEAGSVSRPVEPERGDYRLYYAGIRDALEGRGPAPVSVLDAWRVARLLEWARQSSHERCQIACDWSGEPRSPSRLLGEAG
jgi:scyllo-inositol 2-dehydrogenase (NADP+)